MLRWPSLLDQSAIIAAVVLCAIIVFYAYAVWHWGRFRLRRDDRAADNLYYLGFIFTVCALGISLYRFSVADDGRIADIVGDLGIGISTTVIGLFLRVLFLQREDPADVEDRVQRELIDVAAVTLARIRETGAIVEQGQTLTRQTIDELNDTTEQCATRLTEGMDELHRRVREVEIPPDMVKSRLEPVLDDTARSVAAFSKQIESIDTPADLVSRRLDYALAGLRESAPLLVNETVSQLTKELNETLAASRSQIDDAIKRIEQILVSRVTDIELPTQEIDQRTRSILERFEQSSEHFINAMQRMGSSVAQAERGMSESPALLSRSFESLRVRMTSVFDQLERQVTSVGEGLEAINTARLGDAVSAADTLVQESQKAVGAQRTATVEQTERLGELTSELQSINASIPRLLSNLQSLGRQLNQEPVPAGGNSDTVARRWTRWPFRQ